MAEPQGGAPRRVSDETAAALAKFRAKRCVCVCVGMAHCVAVWYGLLLILPFFFAPFFPFCICRSLFVAMEM